MNNKGVVFKFIMFIYLSLTASEDSKCKLITPVYGLLNSSITLHFAQALKPDSDITWNANTSRIGKFKNNIYTPVAPLYKGRAEIFPNGSLTIFNLTKADEEMYKVEVHNGNNGFYICSGNINLRVLEKLRKPTVTLNGTSLTCTVENQLVERFYLKKAGTLMSDKEFKIITKNNSSIVYDIQQTTGNLECVVNNTLTENSTFIDIQEDRKQLDIYIIASVAGGGILLVLCMTLLIYCIVRQKKHNRTQVYEDNYQLYSLGHDTKNYYRRMDNSLLETNDWMPISGLEDEHS